MKECKEKATLPCYRDDTHDKVYELNKQMCDIGKTLSNPIGTLSEEAIQEMEKALEITRKPKGIIMEKKMNPMTKAEAFEYFKGKRVACDNFNCVAIQHKFFDVGIKWRGGSTKATDERGSFIFVDLNGYLTHCNSRTWFDTHEYEEISADDILSIEIVDEKKYELEFNYDNVVELAKPLMAYLNDVGCRDSIRVSQLGIVHEPMSTLIFDNGIGE